VHGGRVAIHEAGAIQLAQDSKDSASAMHVFYVNGLQRGSHFAEVRNAAREPVDVGHGEGHLALLRGGQQMQHRIR